MRSRGSRGSGLAVSDSEVGKSDDPRSSNEHLSVHPLIFDFQIGAASAKVEGSELLVQRKKKDKKQYREVNNNAIVRIYNPKIRGGARGTCVCVCKGGG